MNFQTLTKLLADCDVLVDGAESHGLLCGMLCGGMSPTDNQWPAVFADLVNNGVLLPESPQQALQKAFDELVTQLQSTDFALQLYLPDDEEAFSLQGQGLINWVNGFNAGFGLHQTSLANCSSDVREGIEDLAQIARMEPPEDDEDIEAELVEIIEYVRVTAMMCFNEHQQQAKSDQATLH
jgi:uncharacterized protein YgfB (UPF0149 family)